GVGSSATGGGVLRTVGNLVSSTGARVKVSPTADIDIYTLSNGANRLIGVSGRTFFTIDLNQINTAQAAGTTKNVVVQGIQMNADTGGRFIGVAAALTSYEAENALLGGGSKVDTIHVGFSGTGFVDYADRVANSFVEFAVNQAGQQTLIFRYANGSAVNRPCNVTINGASVGTVTFPPTGAFTTYRTVTLPVNLGSGSSFRAVRITSTTAAGGPNLDKMNVE
ncbi:MAG: CBM35 domain-containing protein, partial [Candidatus Zixiibacteriota bacterium]